MSAVGWFIVSLVIAGALFGLRLAIEARERHIINDACRTLEEAEKVLRDPLKASR